MVNVSLSIQDHELAAHVRELIVAAGHQLDPGQGGDVWIADDRLPPTGSLDQRPVVVVTHAIEDALEQQRLWRAGIIDLIVMPSEATRLPAAVLRAAEHAAQSKEMRTLRNRLITLLVHDLRNPLGVIKVNLDLLSKGREMFPLEEQIEIIDEVRLANDRALGMLQDLIDIHRAEEGKLRLVNTQIDLSAFMERCYERQVAVVEARELRIRKEFGQHVTINADPECLHRAIDHVLVNSMRHAPRRGEVALGMAHLENSDHATIFIENSGPSLPKDAQLRIFDRYGLTNIDEPSRIPQYRGIGLYLSRLLIEAHHGRIKCSDRAGGGVRFEITLPLVGAPAATSKLASDVLQ